MTEPAIIYPSETEYTGYIDRSARRAGHSAAIAGHARSTCPHPSGSRARVDWRMGWYAANDGKELEGDK